MDEEGTSLFLPTNDKKDEGNGNGFSWRSRGYDSGKKKLPNNFAAQNFECS